MSLDEIAAGVNMDRNRNLLRAIYTSVRPPQRRDLRLAAVERGLDIEWPDTEELDLP